MTKKEFNAIRELIVRTCSVEDLVSLCHYYGVTTSEFYEYVDELALEGFKDKYNQHNHPEHNKEE